MNNKVEIFSPAKINLFLAVIGERGDGFHEILSLVGRVKFGDRLEMELGEGVGDTIECDVDGVPVGVENLIMRAIVEVRRMHSFSRGVRVKLDKRIPMGAGLGGASSNGVAALKGLNTLLGGVLNQAEIRDIAVRLGSDCPIFLDEEIVVVRGRGEEIEKAEIAVGHRISGQRVLIFKPEFSINTAWAYGEMKKNPEYYVIKKAAEVRFCIGIERLLKGNGLESIVYNNFEHIIFKAYPALNRLMNILYEEYNVRGLMSGSGSACFLLLNTDSNVEGIKRRIKEVLGKRIFMIETVIE